MNRIRTYALLAAAALFVTGCAQFNDIQGLFQGAKGNPTFGTGIKQYEDGEYAESAKSLQSALDQGLSKNDQVKAHKTLAFIHCVSGRERSCREEFGKAIALDPDLELDAAESGHPSWGPVFRSVKARK